MLTMIMVRVAHTANKRQHLLRRNENRLRFMPQPAGVHIDLQEFGAAFE